MSRHPKERPQKPSEVRDSGESAGHGAKTAAVRERAILALLTEKTIKAAAKSCRVDEKTLRRWIHEDEAFKAELAEARRAAFQAGMARVQALTSTAVETLEELMGAKKFPSVRLGAARTVAELGAHLHDAETIMQKLSEVEERLDAQQARQGRR